MSASAPPDDFDALIGGAVVEEPQPAPRERRSRAGVIALVTVGLLGVAVAASAFIVPAITSAQPVAEPVAHPAATAAAPSAAPTSTPTPSRSARVDIGDLADESWARGMAASTDIPLRAMQAYAGAALRMATEHPSCGIGWNTLAAIGQVESEHGTIHGGSIGQDGRALPRIVGIPLDGNGVDSISDTDGGTLDGDAHWDRAVGPMQFIPSTWASHGADGNGDGVRDPDSIDDASLAAARYLCEAGDDLTDSGGWIAAISAYNSSIDYNNRVAAAADGYSSTSP
jgi:membrane-bound lytic murein transglycosylase B